MTDRDDSSRALESIHTIARRALRRAAPPPPTCGARTRSGRPCRRYPVPGRRRCRLHGGVVAPATPERRRRLSEASRAAWARYTPEEKARRVEAIRRGKARARFVRAVAGADKPQPKTPSVEDRSQVCTGSADLGSAGCLDPPPRRRVFRRGGPLFGFNRYGEPVAEEQAALDVVERCLAQGRSSTDTARLLGVGGHRRRGGRWSGRHVRRTWERWRAEGSRRSYAAQPSSGKGDRACFFGALLDCENVAMSETSTC